MLLQLFFHLYAPCTKIIQGSLYTYVYNLYMYFGKLILEDPKLSFEAFQQKEREH